MHAVVLVQHLTVKGAAVGDRGGNDFAGGAKFRRRAAEMFRSQFIQASIKVDVSPLAGATACAVA